MTRMRSARQSTSGSSDEINMMATPLSARAVDELVYLFLRSHVDPVRRLVEEKHARPIHEPAAENGFLLIAAAQVLDLLLEARRLHVKIHPVFLGLHPSILAAEEQGSAEGGQARDRHVLLNGELREDPLDLAPLGHEPESEPHRVRGWRGAIGTPSRSRAPPVRARAPKIASTVSVRPAPTRPVRASISPLWISKDTSRTFCPHLSPSPAVWRDRRDRRPYSRDGRTY